MSRQTIGNIIFNEKPFGKLKIVFLLKTPNIA